MPLKYSSNLRNDQVTQLQTRVNTAGGTANLVVYSNSGSVLPANCAAANTGTVLCTIPLPTTFLSFASGVTTLVGSWAANASAAGTALYFRINDSAGTCHIQGDVVNDLVLNNTVIAVGQTVSVTAFTVTAGNS